MMAGKKGRRGGGMAARHYTAPTGGGGWPDATNTGWARTGVTLTTYGGPYFFSSGTVTIDSAHITQTIQITGSANVTISRSWVEGILDCSWPAFVTATDCNIDAGQTGQPGIGLNGMTAYRCNITGGQHSIQCNGGGDFQDNFLHDNWNDPAVVDGYHNNSFLSNGGTDMLIRHNTFKCDTTLTPNNGGPTGDCSMFGDWETCMRITVDNNLFMPTTGSYGGSFGYNPAKPYGSNPSQIVVTNNVFQRGITGINGVYGPVTAFLVSGTGNVWSNNKYEDGAVIDPQP